MTLDEDQLQLRDAVRRLVSDHAMRNRLAWETPCGFDAAVWSDVVQIGLPGIAVDEAHGGSGGSLVDLAVALEELGRGLVPSPLFQTAALAAPLLVGSGDAAAMDRWLPPIAAGELQATVAVDHDARVTPRGTVTGTAIRVIGGATAGLVLLPIGPELVAVELPATGVTVEPLTPLDPSRPLTTVLFDDAPATLVRADPDAVHRAAISSRTLLAAEQVGGAQRCLELAVEHAKTRFQFGKPIGAFQAIKHLCADIYTDVECARALTFDALDHGRPTEAAMAAAFAGEAFVTAAERAMQVLGGIGYTWEHDCHLYLRRARSSERLLGSTGRSYEQVAGSLVT